MLLFKDMESRNSGRNFDFQMLVKSLKMNSSEGRAFKIAEDKINMYRDENCNYLGLIPPFSTATLYSCLKSNKIIIEFM